MPKGSCWRVLWTKAVVLGWVAMMAGLSVSERGKRFQAGPASFGTPVPWDPGTQALGRDGGDAGPYGGGMGLSREDRVETDLSSSHQQAILSSLPQEEPPPGDDGVIWAEVVPLDEALDGAEELMEKAKPYHRMIVRASRRHQVDPDLVKAVIMAESGYDPQAVSREGASGLMQLMPDTAEALGVEDVFNAEHNVNAGVKYLKQLLVEFGHDIELALAAYCVGSGTVRRHQGLPPKEDIRSYLRKILAYYRILKEEGNTKADGA